MRAPYKLLAALGAGGLALACPPYASELMLPVGGTAAIVAPVDSMSSSVPKVTRGQYLGVACANVEHVASDDVRVVMYPANDERPTGIAGVLVTDQTITPGTVHVKVPDMPELADHTVRVKVFFLDASGRHSCDAGKVKVV